MPQAILSNMSVSDTRSWPEVRYLWFTTRTIASTCVSRALERKLWVCVGLAMTALVWYLTAVTFAESAAVADAKRSAARALYWIALGVASSIGLGTGLHTFLLYLVRCPPLRSSLPLSFPLLAPSLWLRVLTVASAHSFATLIIMS